MMRPIDLALIDLMRTFIDQDSLALDQANFLIPEELEAKKRLKGALRAEPIFAKAVALEVLQNLQKKGMFIWVVHVFATTESGTQAPNQAIERIEGPFENGKGRRSWVQVCAESALKAESAIKAFAFESNTPFAKSLPGFAFGVLTQAMYEQIETALINQLCQTCYTLPTHAPLLGRNQLSDLGAEVAEVVEKGFAKFEFASFENATSDLPKLIECEPHEWFTRGNTDDQFLNQVITCRRCLAQYLIWGNFSYGGGFFRRVREPLATSELRSLERQAKFIADR